VTKAVKKQKTKSLDDGLKFNIHDPKLPDWIAERALTSGNYPYDKKLKTDIYEQEMTRLQIELVKLQDWLQSTGERVMILFEGRDAAGKGGTILRLREYLNPRTARNIALPKPDDTERGQWYFQRYVRHFPTRGEFVTFDRSWYNRAGVEAVMGFASPAELKTFLSEVPTFERMLVSDGIRFFKFWLDIGYETQLMRFHERCHNPLKGWKFSAMDEASITMWDDYSRAAERMINETHSAMAPWTIVRSNDKKRARLAVIRRILLSIPFAGRDLDAIGNEDELIIGNGPEFLRQSIVSAGENR